MNKNWIKLWKNKNRIIIWLKLKYWSIKMSSTIYFGSVQYIYDEYGNAIIEHEIGGIRIRQSFDELQQKTKLTIEWHVGNSEYEEVTTFI